MEVVRVLLLEIVRHRDVLLLEIVYHREVILLGVDQASIVRRWVRIQGKGRMMLLQNLNPARQVLRKGTLRLQVGYILPRGVSLQQFPHGLYLPKDIGRRVLSDKWITSICAPLSIPIRAAICGVYMSGTRWRLLDGDGIILQMLPTLHKGPITRQQTNSLILF